MSTELLQMPQSLATQDDTESLQAFEPTALEVMERAQIDVQISTAHRFPRSMSSFLKRGQAMVSIDEETAASCIYRRPVGKENGRAVYAEGESVRLAEIVAACFGNIRASARIVEQTERKVTAMGFAHDLETNYAVQVESVELTVKKDGRPYDERMRMVIAKAALSKAFRDAVFRVVPKSLCKPISNLARQVAVGDAKTLASRRQAVLGWINKAGAEPARVFARLGITNADEIDLDHLETLTGIKTAIKDNELTIDDAFPPVTAKPQFAQPTAPKTEALPPTSTPEATTQQPEQIVQTAPVTAEAKPVGEKEKQLSKLRQRLEDEKLAETAFCDYLVARNILKAGEGIDNLSLPRLNQFADKVGDIAGEIAAGKK